MIRSSWVGTSTCAALMLLAGCGSREKQIAQDFDNAANEKVKALQTLAEEMAKDPEGAGAQASLEQFRIMSLDPAKHPEQAKQIADIYRQKIQGKYRGSVASDLQSDMAAFLKQ